MKAIVQNAYGSSEVVKFKEVDKPQVKENEALVRVHATSLNAGDYFTMKGSPWLVKIMVGFPKPKDHILGWDIAGVVEAVGEKVTDLSPGDEVFGATNHAFAEYVTADAESIGIKPANMSFEQAAAVPTAGLTALQGLRDVGKLQPSQSVLVNGASGGVGTFAVQIAKALGAQVTGVCSTRNVEMVRSLGADQVIDYTKEDFTKGSQRYDLILDNVANRSFSDLRRVLRSDGKIIPNSGHSGMGYVIKAYALSAFMSQQGSPFLTISKRSDMELLKEMIESGKLTSAIDRTYSLNEVPEALEYLGEGHVRGKVVIKIADV